MTKRKKMHEIRTKYHKDVDSTVFTLSNVPVEFDLTFSAGGVIAGFDALKPTKLYDGKLSEDQFKKYKKEITALYKDFDDIYSEINAKYKLKEYN